MSSQWKNLQNKYKYRRVALIVAGALLLIGIGWGLGQLFIKSSQNPPQTDDLPLGDSSPDELETSSSSVPPKLEPKAEEKKEEPAKDALSWGLLLVNNKKPIPSGLVVELEKVSGNYQVDRRIATPLKQMIAAARREGINLELVSAYRDLDEETQLYNDQKTQLESKGFSGIKLEEELSKIMAKPGFSEHQLGLGVDLLSPEHSRENLDFQQSLGHDWLVDNAREYGFVLRYPVGKEKLTFREFNPWHYRYVGTLAAVEMEESQLCLEEYTAYKVSGYDLPQPKEKPDDTETGEEVENPVP